MRRSEEEVIKKGREKNAGREKKRKKGKETHGRKKK